MKIAVIGAGWFGCHIASRLKANHSVTIYDQNGVFYKASMNNQNRLHQGYHYARNSATRNMCKETFSKFKSDYPHILSQIKRNIYAIPTYSSLLDYETYIKIFSDYDFDIIEHQYLRNVQGAIRVDEEYIDPFLSKKFFQETLKDILVVKKINNISEVASNYDLVINCTNNELNPIIDNSFMEPCKIFVYSKLYPAPFDALTLVDGPLFSIFPYTDTQVLISDVEFTPDSKLSDSERIYNMEQKICTYLPDFHSFFKHNLTLSAVKAKPTDASDSRVPIITMKDNIINCFSGKIQGIYYLEDYVRQVCEF